MKKPKAKSKFSEFARGHLLPGRPSILLTQNDKIAIGQDGLTIEYRGKDNCPYGADATANKRSVIGLVVHHTAADHDTDWYVQYQITGDPERRGHFGYHFYIAPDGKIIQGAPLGKRTNHISPKAEVRRPFGAHLQNTNSMGISCVGAGRPDGSAPTAAQANAVSILVFALCDVFTIPFTSVVGHGEIQTNRHRTEGTELAKTVRGWQDEPPSPAIADARISNSL
jgi:hypothetical protein